MVEVPVAWTIETEKHTLVCLNNADSKMAEFYEIADEIQEKFGCEIMAKGVVKVYGRKIVIEKLMIPDKIMIVRKLGKIGLYDTKKRKVCGSGVYGSHEFYEWSDDWDIAAGEFKIIESSKYLEKTENCNFVIHSHLNTEKPSEEDCIYCLSNNIEFICIRNRGKTFFYRIRRREISDEIYSLICTF